MHTFSMKKLAIDVVLFPDAVMTNAVIEINQELLKSFDSKIILHKEKCLPHISLAMGVLEEKDIPTVGSILREIAKEFKTLNLAVAAMNADTISTGEKILGIEVERTEELQRLHEMVMQKLKPYLSYDVEKEMLFNPPEIEEVTFRWIKKYSGKSSFENFSPHITVGIGETDTIQTPKTFTASRIALCHLGNYCTCRKVFAEVTFQ